MTVGLMDAFGRKLEYLRLSVTDRCNFRCVYCLPAGCPGGSGAGFLSVDEIERLARAFASLGFWKVRITGGEPTLRQDVVEIVERVAAVPGVSCVGLTTNGYRLASLAAPLRRAGLSALNVSVDSLDPLRFEELTGRGRLAEVMAGLDAAIEAGVPRLKVNVVLLRGLTDAELDRFVDLCRHRPVTVRFIELMQTADNAAFHARSHLPAAELMARMASRGWRRLPPRRDHGVAEIHGHPDHPGTLGFIAPITRKFCADCNRLRVSSGGDLRLCLFGEGAVPLRPLLAADSQRAALLERIAEAVLVKPAAHRLELGQVGGTRSLATIGG